VADYTASQFGSTLHDYRKHAGLTQIQLADLSTVSVRAIRDLELGSAKRPRRDTVRLLADALRLRAQRRFTFEMAAGQDRATAAFDAISGSCPMPPPSPTGPQYGRDGEHRMLAELLVSGTQRLVAMTGLAGMGKTRLALGVAHELHQTGRMRVLWLPAAELNGDGRQPAPGLSSPTALLASWILPSLASTDGRLSDLVELIGDTALLIVLDGIDGVPCWGAPSCQGLLELLTYCPNLRILLTARPATRLPEAHPFQLRPLPVDRAVPASRYNAAAELLSWHLRSVQPQLRLTEAHSELLAQIAWWLDGIPGALIGAAAWSLLMPLPELADLACRDPLTVSAPPAAQYPPDGLRSDLAGLLAELDPAEQAVLGIMAGFDGALTLPDIAGRANYPMGYVARLLHLLLTQDLIRLVESGGESRFWVLNSVSSLLTRTSLAPSL
jgi:DNA-binding XRE family transcriptional regulator